MKTLAFSRPLALAAAFAAVAAAQASPVLLQDTASGPWGSSYNQTAFNDVFGAGNYTFGLYGSVSAASVFSAANRFVYMEGSDSQAGGMDAFLGANSALIASWVNGGGSLVVNAAPNMGGNIDLGFGATLNYPSFAYTTAATGLNPVSDGPYGQALSLSGNYAAHATITTTGGYSVLYTSGSGDTMVEKEIGMGHVVFSGLTLPFYSNLGYSDFQTVEKNLIAYGASQSDVASVPGPAAALAFVAAAARRRRKG